MLTAVRSLAVVPNRPNEVHKAIAVEMIQRDAGGPQATQILDRVR